VGFKDACEFLPTYPLIHPTTIKPSGSILSNTNTPLKNPHYQFHHLGFNALIWMVFIALALWGFWGSIDIGIGWDEEAERGTLLINLAAINGLLEGSIQGYEALLAHGDRYYGIGFHLPAYALTQILQSAQEFFSITFSSIVLSNASPLILAHVSVWLCFLGSALLVRKLLKQLIANTLVANLGMLVFALWPYLLGHGLMNIKDMPFVFAWLLCTVIALPLVRVFSEQAPNPKQAQLTKVSRGSIGRLILLALVTAWLLSIRISGILIFAQYGCLLISHWYFAHTKQEPSLLSARSTIQLIAIQVAIFMPVFLLALILLYPVAWHNPLELIHAIAYMSQHPWDGTTLTAGRFIAPGNKLYLYVTVWLLAKLPLIAIIGLLLAPWVLYRQSQQLRNQSLQRASQREFESLALWLGLAGGVLVIILALIIMRVGLYNELRQTLFLFPLLFIIGISSLYFLNTKVTLVGLILTGTLFTWDNLTLYPYNYSYLNEVARQRPAVQYFETDYFGFSAGRSARWLSAQPQYEQAECIYAYPMHLLSYELNPKMYPCLRTSEGNARNIPADQQNLLFITQRNLINFPIPEQCTLIHSEETTLPISRAPLIMGRLFDCKPAR
jgi:hypothetical protein